MRDDDRNKNRFLQELQQWRKIADKLKPKYYPAKNNIYRDLEMYKDLFRTFPHGIVIINLDGRIIDCNNEFLKLEGLSKDTIIGKHFTDLGKIRKNEIPKYVTLFSKLINGGDIEPLVTIMPGNNPNDDRIVEIYPTILQKDNDTQAIQVIIRDITKKKLVDNQVKDELEHKEKLFDLLNHDVNNYCQAITLAIELFLVNKDLDEKQRQYLKTSLEHTREISNFTSKVKEYSNLKKGQLTKKVLDVVEVLEESYVKIQRRFPHRNININHNMQNSNVYVNGNELLYSIFDNIIENSVKFNDDDNILLDIATSKVQDGKFWKIEFIDSGPGIPEFLKKRIFNRLDNYDDSISGSGLGLSITKKMVECCGGKIWVEDKVKGDFSKGSNFIVLLPSGEPK